MSAKTARLQPPKKKLPKHTVFAFSAVALAVAITAALIATNRDGKPPATRPSAVPAMAATPAPPPTKASDPAPAPQTPDVCDDN